MDTKNIRNFSIIAHIDHGKSTLADRFLEVTKTVEKRKMREQVLDQMELERERGITIKMQPVRMLYSDYVINLIDTPGHIDFSYEVSRSLRAVEGAVLLVDATQGVQAQTITNVEMAKELGLVIIPVINKIDMPLAQVEETREEIRKLLGIGDFAPLRTDIEGNSTGTKIPDSSREILEISAKTGEGVEELLKAIIDRVPPPKVEFKDKPRALIFDFEYSVHQGIIVYVRVFDGKIKKGDELAFSQAGEKFTAGEIGFFLPERISADSISAGEIGYIVTNIKKPTVAIVGDSIVSFKESLPPLSGYMHPKPVVWASVYPESQDDFDNFRQALDRLRLSDSSLEFEEESSGALGRGFRCGFLGMLHMEIIIERLNREFNLKLITATPTITYKIQFTDGKEKDIYSPIFFPEDHLIKKIFEPWVEVQIISPPEKTGTVMQILYEHEAQVKETHQFGDTRTLLNVDMPLRELMRNFFDELKSATAGYGSLNYKISEMKEVPSGGITRLDILLAGELVPALSRIVSSERIQREAEDLVEKLKKLLPRALFEIKIQAKSKGRILASRSLSALKKDVTGYLYGGDISRKKKLWAKQKKGKKKLKERGKVNIPHDVFIRMLRN